MSCCHPSLGAPPRGTDRNIFRRICHNITGPKKPNKRLNFSFDNPRKFLNCPLYLTSILKLDCTSCTVLNDSIEALQHIKNKPGKLREISCLGATDNFIKIAVYLRTHEHV